MYLFILGAWGWSRHWIFALWTSWLW